MDFGPIPPELLNLSLIEQMLIARVHPVISMFRIHGQQTGYSWHVINSVQHVENFAHRLPNSVGSLRGILVLNRQTPDGLA